MLTLFLGRLSPHQKTVNQYLCTYFCQQLTPDFLISVEGRGGGGVLVWNIRRFDFMINLHECYVAELESELAIPKF